MSKQSEAERLRSITEYERSYWERGLSVMGMDEVGRGPLAGPVTVCCVIMPPEPLLEYVNDSKKVTKRRRALLYPRLIETATEYAVASVPPEVIDEINILEATRRGFYEAFNAMSVKTDDVLLDYISGLQLGINQIPIVHGDALSYTIAAASIIAKVTRDNYMIEMDARYPEYGFARNMGYGTAEHIAAIKKYGLCPIHRRSFISKSLLEQKERDE